MGENRHLLDWRAGKLVAYARFLKSESNPESIVIGRVIVDKTARGEKLGEQLMARALALCGQHWSQRSIYLGAQAHLQAFYVRFGFQPVTAIYDEDGILHIGMAREGIYAEQPVIDYS